jgi:ankyrin repeat protein
LKNAGGARSGLSADEYRALNDIDPKTRHTPLEQAINDNNVDKVRTLLLRGADVRAKGTYGETVVGQAINAGNVAVLKLLLQYDIDKNDALNIAVWAQKHEIVKYLLSIGANPNHGAGNKPPLFAAVYLHDTQMATILLENGADINGQDTSGNTALADVLLHPEYPNPNVAEYLLEKGADIHLKNKQGKSPLDQAMHCPHQYGIVIYRLMQQHNKKKKVSSHFLIGGIPLFLVYFIFIRKSWFTAGRKQG